MFDNDAPVPSKARSLYRYKSNATLVAWRTEMRAEVFDLMRLYREDPREEYRNAVRSLCGRIGRISGILRDRWYE